jgi:hypothetical protein
MDTPRLKRLFSCLLPQKSAFCPRSLPSQYMWDEVEFGKDFLRSTCIIPCHCHSTNAPHSFDYLLPCCITWASDPIVTQLILLKMLLRAMPIERVALLLRIRATKGSVVSQASVNLIESFRTFLCNFTQILGCYVKSGQAGSWHILFNSLST